MGIEYGYRCEECEAWSLTLDALSGHAASCPIKTKERKTYEKPAVIDEQSMGANVEIAPKPTQCALRDVDPIDLEHRQAHLQSIIDNAYTIDCSNDVTDAMGQEVSDLIEDLRHIASQELGIVPTMDEKPKPKGAYEKASEQAHEDALKYHQENTDFLLSGVYPNTVSKPYKLSQSSFHDLAQEAFTGDSDEYDQTDPSWMRKLQSKLRQWEIEKFNGGTIEGSTLGANEEVGELAEALILLAAMKSSTGRMAHAVLKRNQEVRGFDDPEKFLALAADAIADTMVFSIQLASKLKLDAATLLTLTAEDVMERVGATPEKPKVHISSVRVESAEPDRFVRAMEPVMFSQPIEDKPPADPPWLIAANKTGHRGHNIELRNQVITFHDHRVDIYCSTCNKLEQFVEVSKR